MSSRHNGRMRKLLALVVAAVLVVLSWPGAAQERVSRSERLRRDSELRINNVIIRDRTIWYSGHWYHGWYQGRPGWWWVVGGSGYYYYPVPAYPYPEIFAEPVVTAAPVPDVPLPAPAAYWNFCAEPVGYYPYVQNCARRWLRVTPTAAPLAPPPPLPWPG